MAFSYYGFAAALLALAAQSSQVGCANEQDASCDSSSSPASLLQRATHRHTQVPQCPSCAAGQECYCTKESCTCIMQGLMGSSVPAVQPVLPKCPSCAAGQECYCTQGSCTCIAQGSRGSIVPAVQPQIPQTRAPQCPVCAAGQECYCTNESCTCITQGLAGSSLPDTQPAVTATTCSGITAQGKCWYLSETGGTCADTCAKNGRTFSFVVADNDRPLTPGLCGHEPQTKQQAWAALECYVASEDRYHTANANAAKHHTNEELGAFSSEECKLSCPCGGAVATQKEKCTWKQPPACAAQFVYKGVEYAGCAMVDTEHEKAWCQHDYQHTESGPGAPQDWSYCNYDCGSEPVLPVEEPALPVQDSCAWIPAYSCVKEFDYEGTHFVGCTATDHDTPWCSNTAPYKGSWNNCQYSCTGTAPVPTPSDELLCMWQPKQECQGTFAYKGVDYTGCANVDNPTPWCSVDRVHKGSWSTCTKVCTRPSGSVSPQPAPVLPQPTPVTTEEDPCTRHPEAENDVIGASVTLDEAGYKIAVRADSAINMKRFICRVIDRIACKVGADGLEALMGFVPYYSGVDTVQSYARLESELTTLCHAGGKWVQPR